MKLNLSTTMKITSLALLVGLVASHADDSGVNEDVFGLTPSTSGSGSGSLPGTTTSGSTSSGSTPGSGSIPLFGTGSNLGDGLSGIAPAGIFGPGVTGPSSTPTVSSFPSGLPSGRPTPAPSSEPSSTRMPSVIPTGTPTSHPTVSPTSHPSVAPSDVRSSEPSQKPTDLPTPTPPTNHPSKSPTPAPSTPPTFEPTIPPTPSPTKFCIRTETDLRHAIFYASTNSYLPTDIVLCPVVILISKEIYISEKSFSLTCPLGGCTLSGKKAYRIFRGAPAYAVLDGISLIDGLAIEQDTYGGSIWLSGGSMKINDCKFLGNRAKLGGAIYSAGTNTRLVISKTTFSWNKANVDGGAVYVATGGVTIQNSLFGYNDAEVNGGAIFFADKSKGHIISTEFIYNKVPTWSKYGGGGIALDKAKVHLESSFFADNSAPKGSDVYILDDEDPNGIGSLLMCDAEYKKNVVFDGGPSGVEEAGDPGVYINQICVEASYGAAYGTSGGGYPGPVGHPTSAAYTPQGGYQKTYSHPTSPVSYPAPSTYSKPVAYATGVGGYTPQTSGGYSLGGASPVGYPAPSPYSKPVPYVTGGGGGYSPQASGGYAGGSSGYSIPVNAPDKYTPKDTYQTSGGGYPAPSAYSKPVSYPNPAPSTYSKPVSYPTNGHNNKKNGAYREGDVRKPVYGADYGDGYASNGSGTCDKWADWGDDSYSTSDGRYMFNTASSTYDMVHPKYDPLHDSFCFNEEYHLPDYNDLYMYGAYKAAFDEGLSDFSDASSDNHFVSKNRIPSMMLRMCFHDQTIEAKAPKFQDYIHSFIDPISHRWNGPFKWMATSGGDASNLICPAERDHPNNNFEQTASRVLHALQTHLKPRFPDVSYADLDGFNFGRKDACHLDLKCGAKYALCGGSEYLPGFAQTALHINQWFSNRGMTECLWMSLLWTHTTVSNMGTMCPIQKMACTTDYDDLASYPDESRRYFGVGDTLDYFEFFMARGYHEVQRHDPNNPTCYWEVDGQSVYWPLTVVDCELSLDNVRANGQHAVANAILNFHKPDYDTIDIVSCALNMLGGSGYKERGICEKILPSECQSPEEHLFGSYYGGN